MSRRRPRSSKKDNGPQQLVAVKSIPGTRAFLWSLVVFIGVFGVYLLTIIPTAIDQDSGELVTVAHVLGVAHPTGYPLWTLLGRGFDALPMGSTSAFRVALLSAISAAGAAAMVCWMTMAMSGVALAGVFAGVAFGVWFPTWSQAVRAEVYAFEALLFGLFLVILWRWQEERSPRWLIWLSAAGGLVAMHHRTGFLAAAPALFVALWLTQPRRVRSYAWAAAAFVAPFLFYLYLPIRAAANPPLNWGKPDTLERFIAHVSGRQYSKWVFMNSWDMVARQAERLWGECLAGPGWLSVALAVAGGALIAWGFAVSARRRPVVTWPLGIGAVGLSIWVLTWGDVSDSKVWLLPVGAAFALFGGLGLARIAEVFPRRAVGWSVSVLMGISLVVGLVSANWARADQSDVWRHRDQWAAALMQMDEGAIFVAEWDNPMFMSWYLQEVEGLRRDVTVLRPMALSEEWYRETIDEVELRDAASHAWTEVRSRFTITKPGTPEVWETVATFAHELAKEYEGRRTVYALHGPVIKMLPGPPWFVGISDGLYRLSFERPVMVQEAKGEGALAEPTDAVNLVSVEFDRQEVQTGELVGFRARWRLEKLLPGLLFALRLEPIQEPKRSAAPDEKNVFSVQGYPVLYGLWGLGASPAGTVYEQRGKVIVPTNLPAGEYGVEVGFAQSYPPEYGGWVGVEGVRLEIDEGV